MHTPASLVSNYGGDTDEAWKKFFADLNALPRDIEVLGVNDYVFVDGYRRVRDAWERGQIPNIRLVLPVVELRIDKFAGTGGALKRVNYHVIFSDEVSADTIEQQFLSKLNAEYYLNPNAGEVVWNAAPSRQSLEDLGKQIIGSVPPEKRAQFGPPLTEGFNNFNVSLQSVQQALQSHYFKKRYITAVGKTEWSSIKWNDGSIADKKTIVNGVDFIFVAAESPEMAVAAKKAMVEQQVNSRLLDCSDAHNFSDSTDKDRLGNCCTWIRADPTFDGLRHVVQEADQRVWLGGLPPQLQRIRRDPTRVIERVELRRTQSAKIGELWFDGIDVPLNPGLVAIIGRKGSGKSALLDTVGLAGDSSRQEHASFLRRFCRPEANKGGNFEINLRWYDGQSGWRRLDSLPGAVERVTYVPQHLFEAICNELSGEKRGLFDSELKRVIFSHVPVSERLAKPTADEWLRFKSEELEASRAEFRFEIEQLNIQIVQLENALAPENRKRLEALVSQREQEVEVLRRQEPEAVQPPSETLSAEQKALLAELETAVSSQTETNEELLRWEARDSAGAFVMAASERLIERVGRLERAIAQFKEESEADFAQIGVEVEDVINVTISRAPINAVAQGALEVRQEAARQRDASIQESAAARAVVHANRIAELQAGLDKPNREYQEYLARRAEWLERVAVLVGDAESPDSLEFVKAQVRALEDVPQRLGELEGRRRETARRILETYYRAASLLGQLYGPVQALIDGDPIARERVQLKFIARVEDAGFTDGLLNLLHQGRVGSFSGREEGEKRAREIVSRYQLGEAEEALGMLDEIRDALMHDRRLASAPSVRIADQLRGPVKVEDLYDFLFGFEFLEARYAIQFGDRDIDELSPGEKGALLLVFYLLLDTADTPLLIDQPEENLDNETVFDLLVPAMRFAKDRRQVIIVTHNPNLAIACDADQIVCASRDVAHGNRIEYETGAIENPAINRRAVDVLEGTMPAFMNRSWKYM